MTFTITRPRLFIVGFLLISFGQFLMTLPNTNILIPLSFSKPLNQLFRFDIDNLDNVILAVLLLLIGMLVISRAFMISLPRLSIPSIPCKPSPKAVIVSIVAMVIVDVIIVVIGLQHRQKANDVLLVGLWLLALIVFAGAMFNLDRSMGVDQSTGLQRSDVMWMIGLFAITLVIASFQLDRIPNSMLGDEGAFWDQAHHLARNIDNRSFFDIAVYGYPLASSIYQALFLKIFGSTLWAWRFSSVFAAALAIFPTYWFAQQAFNRRTAILACALLPILPYFLAFARMGYNNSQALFPVIMCVALLYAALKRGSLFYFALSGIAAGLGFYTYTAGILGGVIALGFLGIIFLGVLIKRGKGDINFLRFFAGGVIFGLALLVMVVPQLIYVHSLYPERANFKFFEALMPNAFYANSLFPERNLSSDHPIIEINGEEFFVRFDLYVILFVRGVFRTLAAFHHPQFITNHYMTVGMVGPIITLFYTLGVAIALKHPFRTSFGLLLAWFFGGVLFLSAINTTPPRQAHLVSIIPAIAIMGALGLGVTADFIDKVMGTETETGTGTGTETGEQPKRPQSRASQALIPLILGLMAIFNGYQYFVQMPLQYKPDAENIMAFSTLLDNSQGTSIYVVNDPDRAEFIPWLVHNVPNQAIFQTVQASDLFGGKIDLSLDTDYTFYFHESGAGEIVRFLNSAFGVDYVPFMYTDPEARPVLLRYSHQGRQ